MTNEKNSKQPGGYKPPQNTRKKRKKNRFQARVLAFLFLVVLAAAAYHLYYRYDGKGDLTHAEIAAHDVGREFENGYRKTHQSGA